MLTQHLDCIKAFRHIKRIGAAHLPPFHTLGTVMQLFAPLSQGTSVALYPPTSLADHRTPITVPTSDNARDHAQRCGVTGMVTVPSFVESWAHDMGDAAQLGWLRGLQFMAFAGGPLATKIGDALAGAGVNIVSVYGVTEAGCPTTLEIPPVGAEVDASEWPYMRFSPGVNVRWVPQGDGTFESQFLVSSSEPLSTRL